MVEEEGMVLEAWFWKTWIGRASKNSWARMKGVDVSSILQSVSVSIIWEWVQERQGHTFRDKSQVLAPDDIAAWEVFASVRPT